MTPDQATLEGQGLPPGMSPDDMAAMQSEQGGQGVPPELMAMLQGGQPPMGQQPVPNPQAGGDLQSLLASLPPEVLQQLLAQQGQPPVM